jgi:hypothetical protein
MGALEEGDPASAGSLGLGCGAVGEKAVLGHGARSRHGGDQHAWKRFFSEERALDGGSMRGPRGSGEYAPGRRGPRADFGIAGEADMLGKAVGEARGEAKARQKNRSKISAWLWA